MYDFGKLTLRVKDIHDENWHNPEQAGRNRNEEYVLQDEINDLVDLLAEVQREGEKLTTCIEQISKEIKYCRESSKKIIYADDQAEACSDTLDEIERLIETL